MQGLWKRGSPSRRVKACFLLHAERRIRSGSRSIRFREKHASEQNIIFPLLLDYKKPKRERVDEILEVLGLADRRKHLPGQLSGGQQQRVAIGRALITRPILVLADEPTGNLDSQSSRDVMDLLCKASRHYQQTVLMITHNMSLTSLADRVFEVTDGELGELGGVLD